MIFKCWDGGDNQGPLEESDNHFLLRKIHIHKHFTGNAMEFKNYLKSLCKNSGVRG